MKVLYSGVADRNHSMNGGYHHIINNPTAQKVLLSSNFLFGKLDKKFRLRKITYLLLDIKTRVDRKLFDITHLYYADLTMFPFLGYARKSNNKLVATIHLDLEKQHFGKFFIKNLRTFDGVIVLSSQQKEYYKKKYNIETTFIPHGFDKPVFDYSACEDSLGRTINKEKINIISLGKNYRDFDLLYNVVNKFKGNQTIQFHLVGVPKSIKQKFRNCSNVSIYGRLNDNQYYSLISECDYHFLPLLFATANNALLEAQNLGITSILPKLPGVLDYAAPAPNNFFYESIDDLCKIIQGLEKRKCNQELIKFAEQFSWINIYTQLNAYYKSLFKSNELSLNKQ